MEKAQVNVLFRQFIDNTISRTDYEKLMDYVRKFQKENELFDFMSEEWEKTSATLMPENDEMQELYNKIINDARFS